MAANLAWAAIASPSIEDGRHVLRPEIVLKHSAGEITIPLNLCFSVDEPEFRLLFTVHCPNGDVGRGDVISVRYDDYGIVSGQPLPIIHNLITDFRGYGLYNVSILVDGTPLTDLSFSVNP